MKKTTNGSTMKMKRMKAFYNQRILLDTGLLSAASKQNANSETVVGAASVPMTTTPNGNRCVESRSETSEKSHLLKSESLNVLK